MAATIATETETLFTDVAEMDNSDTKICDEDLRQSAEDEQKRLIALGIATEEIKKIEGPDGRENLQAAQQVRIDRLIQNGSITQDGRVVIGGESSNPMDLDVLTVSQEVQKGHKIKSAMSKNGDRKGVRKLRMARGITVDS